MQRTTYHIARSTTYVVVCMLLWCAVATQNVQANDIAVSSVTLTGRNTTSDFTLVQFNLSWSNSWRVAGAPVNWDAAWVFVKYSVGETDPTFDGASSSGTTVTVSSTAKLRIGMPVRVVSGTGAFATNTVISSITNATQFVVSATPTTALSNATIECLRIWEHAWLNNTGHTAPTGSTIDAGLQTPADGFNATTNPALGVFVYRSAAGNGTNTFNNVQLRWNYGANGIADTAFVRIRVFAIEMVRVPQGAFYVGSGGTESGSFTNGSWTTGATIPFQITSEAALGIDNAAGKLWGTSSAGNNSIGNAAADAEATLAAAYPKGFAAFYCMKYEISQGQYRDFLNTLTYQQQVTRTAVAPTSAAGTGALSSTNANRNGIDIQTPASATTLVPAVYACNLDGDAVYNESVDGEWIACNFLTWMDGCAYMDWAGLRPMTELEFEKACRGDQTSVANEYAWGAATITEATGINNGGSNNEVSTNAGANAILVSTTLGPIRVGAFAGAATTRAQAGATYYGIMEMSSNLYERSVTIGNAAGRSYTGVHGDGALFTDGTANVDFWPGINGNSTDTDASTAFGGTTGVTQAAGSGSRGAELLDRMRVSDRGLTGSTSIGRTRWSGFRGVRRAP